MNPSTQTVFHGHLKLLISPHFFFSLQHLCCIQTHINSQTNETKPVIEERTAFISCHSSTWYNFWGWIFLCTRKMSKTVRTDSHGSAGDPSLLSIRVLRSSPDSSSFSRSLRRPHSQSAYAPCWPQEYICYNASVHRKRITIKY